MGAKIKKEMLEYLFEIFYFFVLIQKSNKKNQGHRKMAKIFFVALQQKSLKPNCGKIIRRRLVKEFCEEPRSFCCSALHSENLSRSNVFSFISMNASHFLAPFF